MPKAFKSLEKAIVRSREYTLPTLSYHLNHENVEHYLKFLQFFNAKSDLFGKNEFLRNAIRRYETCWIPFIAKKCKNYIDDLKFAPPLDVHWIWHCHMLSPVVYSEDLSKEADLGRPINHMIVPWSDLVETRAFTKGPWQEMFPDEPFEIDDVEICLDTEAHQDSSSFSSCDLINTSLKYIEFYSSFLSLKPSKSKTYLLEAVRRYKMYLYLKNMYPEQYLTTTNDIELVWNAHKIMPYHYKNDVNFNLSYLLPHQDPLPDEVELRSALRETKFLWQDIFGEAFDQSDETPCRLRSIRTESKEFYRYSTHLCLTLCSFEVFTEGHLPKADEYSLKVYIMARNEKTDVFEKKRLARTTQPLTVNHASGHLSFSTLTFNMTQGPDQGFMCVLRRRSKAKGLFAFFKKDAMKVIDKSELLLSSDLSEGVTKMQLKGLIGTKFMAELVVETQQRQHTETQVKFCLKESKFETKEMGDDFQDLWGPLTLSKLPKDNGIEVQVAKHKITTEDGQMQFKLRVLHSLPMEMSAVHLVTKSGICVLAQIADGQSIRPYLGKMGVDPRMLTKKWRAMVIKDKEGDWALCIGAWMNMVQTKDGKAEQQESIGYFKMCYLNLRTKERQVMHLPVEPMSKISKKYVLSCSGLKVDLEQGHMIIDRTQDDGQKYLPQLLVLGVTVTILYLLVQPRSFGVDEAALDDMHFASHPQERNKPLYLDNDRLNLVLACGWRIRYDLPSNVNFGHLSEDPQ